ncbi:Putative Replication factor-A protein [Podospora comata]|uniref:Replication protein A subunit n=1 Tax=Podospora comata TaxID=48703 RepID=A0ABY6S110_PODCO|nr:Putative Replication factor-A protein [Podospora comata]
MAEQAITQGAIEAIFSDPERARAQYPVPVLQCLQIKTLDSKGGGAPERYRIVLSDVRNYVQCMLATQANHVVHEGKLKRGGIVRMKSYQAQALKGKNVLIVLELEAIESLGAPDKIGNPVGLEGGAKLEEAQPAAAAAAAPAFYGAPKGEPTQESKSQVQRQLASRSNNNNHNNTRTSGGVNSTIYPIEALSPYAHKWTIKARLTHKSDIKTWHKNNGEGKLFSVNLLDESSEIKATMFNDQVDQFYDVLQEGQVYYISAPCRVQLAKKQFSNLPNDYELTFERDTVVEKAEDQSSVPQVRFNFCNIQELQSVEKDATVDVLGVLKTVHEVSSITSKSTQKPYDKRELELVDQTGYSVRVTVWGKTATEFQGKPEEVIAFKGTRVSDFNGRSLSLLSSGTMAIDPDIPEAHALKGWYDSTGRHSDFATHSNMSSVGAASGRTNEILMIQQVKEKDVGFDKPEYFSVQATIVHVKQDNFCYPACRSEGCNKKVTDMGDGTWRCEKCDVTHDRPEYRYILNFNCSDHTGQIWLSCFDEQGRKLLGASADELMEWKQIKESGDASDEARKEAEVRFTTAFDSANCRKMTFRARAKMDTYGEQQRVRYQLMEATPLDYKMEGNRLAEMIRQLGV